jgi:uncharacterized protein YuzB (UPF0349 family)
LDREARRNPLLAIASNVVSNSSNLLHMEKLLFLSLFSLGLSSTNGQIYQKLLRQNVTWDVIVWDFHNQEICQQQSIERYFLKGEKIIDGKKYQIVVGQDYKSHTFICDWPNVYIDTLSTYEYAYVREDTITQKVYKYDVYCNREILLYDFSLEKNDTFNTVNYSCDSVNLRIDSTSQFKLKDGSYVKGYCNNGYFENIQTFSYYQRIGSFYNPFNFGYFKDFGFESGSGVACIKDNNVVIYGDELLTDVKIPYWINRIKVYPNPTFEIINIKYDKIKSSYQIQIMNIFGQRFDLIKSKKNDNTIEINLFGLPSGIYILNIQTEANLNYKFIKYK